MSHASAADLAAHLQHLEAEIDGLVGADWGDAIPGAELGEAVVELTRLQAKLGAVQLDVTQAFDRSARWRLDGALAPSAWIRRKTRMRDADAKRQVRRSRNGREMPITRRALRAGAITLAHLDVLANARGAGREELFARDEELLVSHAERLSFRHFAKAVRYWVELANDSLGQGGDDEKKQRRGMHFSETLDGTWRADGTFAPLDGAEIANELERLMQIDFENDWVAARERLGRQPTVDELDRTPAQRRADALLEMARRSAATSKPGEPAPRALRLRMDYETFVAEMARMTARDDVPYPAERVSETADGTIVAPSALLDPRIAVQVRRIVFSPKGQVLEYGRSKRLFDGALREAIEERDQECTHVFCETPARHCQVDHVEEWEDHGETGIENGELQCGPHNREKHLRKRVTEKRRRRAA